MFLTAASAPTIAFFNFLRRRQTEERGLRIVFVFVFVYVFVCVLVFVFVLEFVFVFTYASHIGGDIPVSAQRSLTSSSLFALV